MIYYLVFNTTFSSISTISWLPSFSESTWDMINCISSRSPKISQEIYINTLRFHSSFSGFYLIKSYHSWHRFFFLLNTFISLVISVRSPFNSWIKAVYQNNRLIIKHYQISTVFRFYSREIINWILQTEPYKISHQIWSKAQDINRGFYNQENITTFFLSGEYLYFIFQWNTFFI